MKEKRFVAPFMHSADMRVNMSITLAKLHNRIRLIDRSHKRPSFYQSRLKHKRAARRVFLHSVR